MRPDRAYDHVLGFALEHPWAVTRPMLSVIATILARHVAGQHASAEEIQAALVNRKNLPQPTGKGGVAVIPIYGVIAPRINLLSDISGGTTFEALTAQLRAAVANKAVSTIVLDIDSPGGSVAGATEFAADVRKARAQKPVIAQGQFLMASAAYWVGSAATKIVAAPSSMIGSIGAYTAHDDISQALAALGVTRTILSAGIGKVDGNEAEPLSDEARGRIQALIDSAYGQFVGDVVKNRGAGMTADRVKADWKALIYTAADAKRLGMIDEIATLDETIASAMTKKTASSGASARARSAPALVAMDPMPGMADPAAPMPDAAGNVNCTNCTDCSGCTDCADCTGCTDCEDCAGCDGCTDCESCTGCSACTDCEDCSGCTACSDCERCAGCSSCSDCEDCRGCADCAGMDHGDGMQGGTAAPTDDTAQESARTTAQDRTAAQLKNHLMSVLIELDS